MLLRVEDLAVSFRDDEGRVTSAARNVNLALDRGEVLGLVGESGSGKSSVALSVPRLLPSPPAFWPRGRILFDGHDVLAMPLSELRRIRGRRIGVVFQDPMGSLSPLHRIGDQLVETVRLHEPVSRRAARARALSWLDKVGIPDPETRSRAYPHELSGGMQQRVMIAMALMLEPDLLIADEPTTALDVTTQRAVLDLMARVADERRMAVLLITHNLGLVARYATFVNVMYAGEIVERGNVREVLRAPRHPYTQGLIAAVPRLDAPKDAPLADIPGTVPPPTDWPSGCAFHPRCPKARPECAAAAFAAAWQSADSPSVRCLLCR